MTTTSKLTLAAVLVAGSGLVLPVNQALASTSSLETLETTALANLDLPVHFVSQEAELVQTQFQVMQPGIYTPAVDYLVTDLLHIVLDTDALDVSSLPQVLSAQSGSNGVTFSYISAEQSSHLTNVYYRVTSVIGSTISLDVELKFSEWEFDAAKLNQKPVAMSIQVATSGGITIMNEIAEQLIIDRYQESYRLEATSGAGSVDKQLSWDEQLQRFESGNDASYTIRTRNNYNEARQSRIDQGFDVSFLRTNACFIDQEPVTTSLEGDFSWLREWNSETQPADLLTAEGIVGPTGSWVTTERPWQLSDNTVTFEPTEFAQIDVAFDLTENEQSIAGQTLHATQRVKWKNCNDATITAETEVSAAIADWQVEGIQIDIPYLPYRHDISQKLILTQQWGDAVPIRVQVLPEKGELTDLGEITVSTPKAPQALHEALAQALELEGLYKPGTMQTERFGVRILLPAPPGSVSLHSEYNVKNESSLVVNSLNL